MVIDIPIAVALGFDEPSGGLMDRRPRPLTAPVLSSANWVRLVVQGLVMATGSLVAYQIVESEGPAVASTVLLTTMSLFHLVGGLLARDQRNSIFDRAALPGPTQMKRYGVALLLTIAVTGIDLLQRIVGTTSLTFAEWGICIGIASSLVVVEELIKFFIRRREQQSVGPPQEVDPELELVAA
jgi:P-type Ca2+ transporter type 2C